ncbi:hypothetical protein D3C76_924050 [compost metagenome]
MLALAEPSKETEPVASPLNETVLALANLVAVAAFPVTLPGKLEGIPVTSLQATCPHDELFAVAPAFSTLPLFVVPVAGTCTFPSPVG